MVRVWPLIPVLVALFLGNSVTGAAPETVDPELCSVPPITSARLIEIAAAPPEAGALAPESGAAVSRSDVDAIRSTIRASVACTNANNFLASAALFTDRYLGERFGGDGNDDLGHLLAALSRQPAVADPVDRLTVVSVDEPTAREDGSVTVTVVTENAANRFVDAVTLVAVRGQWLIDRVELQEAIAATPVA